MTDLQILNQLLNGYHLEKKEVKQAKTILRRLKITLKQQTKK